MGSDKCEALACCIGARVGDVRGGEDLPIVLGGGGG